MNNKVNILGVNIEKITLNEASDKIEGDLLRGVKSIIYTPNTEIVMEAKKDEKLKDILNRGDLVIPDGIGLIYAGKIKKKPLKERVTGFDISLRILEIANKNGNSIFLLGGAEGVAKKASEEIKEKYPNVRIVGYNNGYFRGTHIGMPMDREEVEIIEKINNSDADVLFVGFGAPRQEFWIDNLRDKLKVKLIIGNGGTMDVIAGKVKRAPKVYQKLGLEWLYRLVKEPSRIKRQIAIPKFIATIIFTKNSVK